MKYRDVGAGWSYKLQACLRERPGKQLRLVNLVCGFGRRLSQGTTQPTVSQAPRACVGDGTLLLRFGSRRGFGFVFLLGVGAGSIVDPHDCVLSGWLRRRFGIRGTCAESSFSFLAAGIRSSCGRRTEFAARLFLQGDIAVLGRAGSFSHLSVSGRRFSRQGFGFVAAVRLWGLGLAHGRLQR